MAQLIVSGAAGVVATVITHPLDTWTVHLQTGRQIELRPRVLYRGLTPACLQASIIYTAFLGSYDYVRRELDCSVLLAASASALPESLVKGPLETLKNLHQTKRALPKTLKGRAQLALKGTMALVCRELPGNMAYFTSYDWVRQQGYNAFLGGAVAGACFTFASYPIETMRSQLVTGKKIRPTMRGIGPFITRAMVVTAVLLQTYDWTATIFNVDTSIGKVTNSVMPTSRAGVV